MPILATITTISFLRRNRGQGAPFTSQGYLQMQLKDALTGDAEGKLQPALKIVVELDSLLQHYQRKLEISIDTYIEESVQYYIPAAEMIERLTPFDLERSQVLQRGIELRQELFELLDDAQWAAVFD